MPGLGHNGYLAFVKEVTWGTDPGSGYGAQAILKEKLETKVATLFGKPIVNGREGFGQKVPGGITAGGTIDFDVDVEGLVGPALKGILSAETYVSNGSGNGGTHTFVPGNTVPPSYSFLLSRDTNVSSSNIWDFTGGVFDQLSFSASEGQVLKCTATVSCLNGVSAATGTVPSYTSQQPLVYHTGTILIGGNAVNLKSFKLDIASGNFNKRGALGTRTIQQQQPGYMKVSGTVTAYFDALTLVALYTGQTDTSINLTFTGTAIGTSTRSLQFVVPVAQFQGETPSLPGADQEIMLTLPFTAWLSGAGSPNHIVEVILVNSQQSAY